MPQILPSSPQTVPPPRPFASDRQSPPPCQLEVSFHQATPLLSRRPPLFHHYSLSVTGPGPHGCSVAARRHHRCSTPGPSVAAAAVGTRREPLMRLRSLECRGPLPTPALAQPAPRRLLQCLMPWTPGSQVDMAAGLEDWLGLQAVAADPRSKASGLPCLSY